MRESRNILLTEVKSYIQVLPYNPASEMTDRTKAKIKVLEMAVSAMRLAAKARDIHERLAAVELEAEFTERAEKLRTEDREPPLPLTGTEG